ncbi:MAG: DUF2975 domain-containing protein [Candidatus Magasanikbacteria bacterium]|nr:DUF2975 domain-containing protein [Candidatus Magasanikbacteria bacterium]
MKRGSTIFLQVVIVLIGTSALALMLWEPHVEGVNAQATTLYEIYFDDPFLAYAYIGSIAFFVALYQAFKLLGYIRQNKIFSPNSVKALRTIKYCAIVLSILIVMAGLYIRIFHAKNDDPAGFIAMSIMATFISIVIATAAAVFEKTLQSAIDIKSENDLTV